VPADELLPSRRLPPFGSRCDVVAAQDVAHRLVGNGMTQVGQRTGDADVTPTRVLAGEVNDQFLYRAIRFWLPTIHAGYLLQSYMSCAILI
jgi:hypothetical protein